MDLRQLMTVLLGRIWIIALSAVGCGLLAYVVTAFFITPLYTATASMYVFNEQTRTDTSITTSDLAVSQKLVDTYIVILKSDSLLDEVAESLGNRYSAEDLRKMMTAASINATEAFSVAVVHEDPQEAQTIANTIVRMAPDELLRVVKAGAVEIIDYAKLPQEPSSPNVPMNTAVGFLLGLVLVVVAVLLYEAYDSTVRTEEDITQTFTIPLIGIVPALESNGASSEAGGKKWWSGKQQPDSIEQEKSRLLSYGSPFSVAEAYRAARTNLMFLRNSEYGQKVVFSSSGPSEGKTTNCINMSITLAQNGQRVLVIDADMRKPKVHRLLYLESSPGLSEYLAGISSEPRIRPCNVDNMFVLTAGKTPPNPAELLSSQRMLTLLEEMKQQYDYVIVDTPPLNLVTDAAVLADKVDGFVLIAMADATDMEELKYSVQALEKVQARIAGFILNAVQLKSGRYYRYRYGKYGRYGYRTKYERDYGYGNTGQEYNNGFKVSPDITGSTGPQQ